jgi:phosphotransacetylase
VRVTALLQRAALRPARLLLAGGDVSKLQKAAARLAEAGFGAVQVVGAGSLPPEGHPRLDSVALLLRSRAPNRVRDGIHALDLASDPVRFAAGLLALGDVDVVVAGPGVSYQDLTEAVDWTLGAPLDGGPVHSATWLLCTDGSLVGFADCEIQGEGAPPAQARLARAVAHIHARLSEAPARVSFLTGPPWREENRAAADAVERLKDIDPSIMAEADPAARFRGRPDVLIFSGGTAGHLAARTVRALAGALLLGPLLLGPPGTVAGVAEESETDELVGTAALAVLAAGTAAT